MSKPILLASLVVMCFSYTTVYAADVFRLDITKIVEACQTESFEENPTSGLWFSFDDPRQLTVAFNPDFENPIVMKMVRYIKSATRADFVAIRADFIQPAVQDPVFGAWFFSIYGKITLDEDLQPVSLKGEIHASFVSPEGNQNEGRECLLRMKFRSVEQIE
ncbi:MAG TPA: hypothetical protein EYG58_02420 [Nitrospirales bacterium]|jgi:hypothetical protein|nr:hypothetical protein [Nitrospirales bacterium]HIB54050.1 hypothetical protein [Nitrospirales bacterium]HIC04348.1 hypothetical protein [Nitrospirales bacterium]HIO69385.1 hypothetical protein [Nitrospirales bacterium]